MRNFTFTASKIKNVFLVLILTFLTINVFAQEGSNQVSPNPTTSITSLLTSNEVGVLVSGSFFNCPDDNRVKFIISSTNESFYFGFDWYTYVGLSPTRLTNLYWRIRTVNPIGAIPAGGVVFSGRWDETGATGGRITTFAQALNGPNIGGVTTGYNPITFTPTAAGEYWIEYFRGTSVTTPLPAGTRSLAPIFDFTVADNSGAFTKRPGRVSSEKWGFVAVAPTSAPQPYIVVATATAEPVLYSYTADQVNVKIDFEAGFRPVAFDVAVNSYGVNSGQTDWNIGRRSINSATAPSLVNGYRVFLNIPDPAFFPLSALPTSPTFLNPSITGCGPYSFNYNTTSTGDVKLILDLDGTPGYQTPGTDRLLEAFNVSAGNNTIVWDGLNGAGVAVVPGTNLNLSLSLLRGRFNLPLNDAEINTNGIKIGIVSPSFGTNAIIYWDDTLLTPVGATCDLTGGTTNTNNLSVGGTDNSLLGRPSPSHSWNGNGNPTNLPAAPAIAGNDLNTAQCDDFGNVRVINTWGWGAISLNSNLNIVFGCADLSIDKTVDVTTPLIGTNVTFTLSVNNAGPAPSSNTVVTDLLPSPGYTYVSDTSGGSYNPGTGIWTIGTIASLGNASIQIVATVNPTGPYLNTASITGSSQEDPDSTDRTNDEIIFPNNPPVADNDTATTASDTNVNILASTGDTDTDGTINPASIDLDPTTPLTNETTFTVPGEGTYTANPDGTVTFDPLPTFSGTTTPVNYTIEDNDGANSNIATLTVTVANNPPVADNDTATTPSDTNVNILASTGDTDTDGTINPASIDLDPTTPLTNETTFTVPGEGTYTANPDGTVTFDPLPIFSGTTTPVNYTIEDNDGANSNIATLTVTVANNPPVADNDTATTASDTNVNILASTGDTDTDGTINPASIDLDPTTPLTNETTFTVPGEGTYTANPDGTVTFDPLPTFSGTTTPVNYTIEDNDGANSNIATLTVTVANNPPVADNDTATTASDTNVNILASTGDTDTDGTINPASIDLDPTTPLTNETTFTVPGEGTYTANPDGTVTFDPLPTFSGTTTPVNYTIEDNDGANSNIATLTVTVANNPPVADNDTATTASDTNVNILASTGDTDTDGTINPASIDLDPTTPLTNETTFTVPGEGTYTANPDGTVTFDPLPTFSGTTTPVNYTIEDNDGANSNIATLTVTVANNPPTADNDSASTPSDTNVNLLASTGDTDTDGTINPASIDLDPTTPLTNETTFTVPGEGTYTANPDGTVTFDPLPTFSGTTTPVNYTIEDNDGANSNIATLTVTVANNPPVADNDTATTASDTNVNILASTGDTDTDGTINPASIDLDPTTPLTNETTFTVPGEGTYTANPDGTVTFDPLPTFSGTTTPVNYTIEDNDGANSNIATLTVSVGLPPNVPPVATDVTQAPVIPSNSGATTIDTLVATDADGTVVSYTVLSLPTNGVLALAGTPVTVGQILTPAEAAALTYDPSGTFVGDDTFTFTATDNSGAVDATPATYTIPVGNVPPVAVVDPTLSTANDTNVTIPVLTNDTDLDGTIDTATVDLDPTTPGQQTTLLVPGEGTYSVSPLGVITFDPLPTFTGTTTPVCYTVNDNLGATSNPACFTVAVGLPPNVPPVATDVTQAPVIPSNSGATTIDTLVATDADGTVVSYTVLSLPTNGVLALGGVPVAIGQVLTPAEAAALTYDPSGTFVGDDTFTFTATDNSGAVDATPATYTIPVGNVPPVAVVDPTLSTANDTNVTIPVLTNDTDLDGTIDTATVDLDPTTPGQQTTLLVPGEGTYSVSPLGVITFDPLPTFTGTTTPVCYTVNDNLGATSNPACFTVAVGLPPNVPPVATDVTQAPVIPSNSGATTIDTLVATDADGTVVSYTVLSLPTNGVLALAGTPVTVGQVLTPAEAAALTYDPSGTFVGDDTFTFTATDNSGAVDATPATYTIPVGNVPPVAVVDPTLSTANDTNIDVPVLTNDTDLDGTIDPATVDLDPTTPGQQTTLLVPGEGTYSVSPLGVITFDPLPTFTGTTTPVCYTVNDNLGATSNPACFTVAVGLPPNVPPVATDVTQAPVIPSNSGATTIDTLVATDADGTVVSYTVLSLPTNGVLALAGTPVTVGQILTPAEAAALTYDPSGTFVGNDTFTFTATDNSGAVDATPATYTIPVGNVPPVAVVDPTLSTANDTNIDVPVLTNDTDLDGTIDPATVDLDPTTPGQQTTLTVPGEGTYSVSPLGVITFDPLPTFTGTTTPVCYTVNDNLGATSNPACFTVAVGLPPNVPPVATDVTQAPVIPSNSGATTIDTLVATDADGTVVSYTVLSLPTNGVLALAGTPVTVGQILTPAEAAALTYDPSGTFVGDDTFTFTATDNSGAVDATPATYTIPVGNVPPVAVVDPTLSTANDTNVTMYQYLLMTPIWMAQ